MTDPPTGGLLSVDPKTGKTDGEFPWRSRMYTSVNAASPVVVGNAAFVTESYTEGGAFLRLGAQGTLLWFDLSPKGAEILSQVQLFQAPETWGIPTVCRGLLYVNQNAMGARLICYDLRG